MSDARPYHRVNQSSRSDAAVPSCRSAEPQNAPVDDAGATTTVTRSTLLHPNSISTDTVLAVPIPPQLKVPKLASRVVTDCDAGGHSAAGDHFSHVDNEAPTSGSERQPPVPPPLTNLPRRRSPAVDRNMSVTSGSVNRGAGLRLDLSDIANANKTSNGTGRKKDEHGSKQDEISLSVTSPVAPPIALQTAPANNPSFPSPTVPASASPHIYVRPTPEQLQARQRQREAAQRQSMPSVSPAPSFIRKKSGELVKPSLKSVSMFNKKPGGEPGGELGGEPGDSRPGFGLRLKLDGLPTANGTRSEPTTPSGHKVVHFDARLEHVKRFLTEQKPLAVSRDGSPTETSEGGDDFFSHKQYSNGEGASTNSDGGRSSEDEKVRKMLAMHVMNMPAYESALDALRARWENEHVRLESLSLADDRRSVGGTVLVRNLAYGKRVAARFTMDCWQTTSEVIARYVEGVLNGAYDRFEFTIRLTDYLGGKIWGRVLEIAIRYSCDSHSGDMWDNNNGKNYVVQFRRRTLPIIQPKSETNSDDEEDAGIIGRDDEQAGLNVAQLKKSLEKVALVPPVAVGASSPPTRPGRILSPSANPTSASVGSAVAQPSFINSRSAADALQNVGRQSSPFPALPAINRTLHLGTDAAPPPLPPRRNREGTLAGRYDISSSLRNASLNSPTSRADQTQGRSNVPTSPPPLSRTTPASKAQTSPPQYGSVGRGFAGVPGQQFVSRNVMFNMRSTGRGSPRDALTLSSTTPGGLESITSSSLSPPYRISSDSDLPASFQSYDGFSPPNLVDDIQVHHHSLEPRPSSDGAPNISTGEATNGTQLLSSSGTWDSAVVPMNITSRSKSLAHSAAMDIPGSRSIGYSPPSEIVGIEQRLNGSPPVPRFHAFPPLSDAPQDGALSLASPVSSLSVTASGTSTSTIPEMEPPKAETSKGRESPAHSTESSTAPSPSLTTDSTAMSSPISPPDYFPAPTYSMGAAAAGMSTRGNDSGLKDFLGDFLDEYVQFSTANSASIQLTCALYRHTA